MSEPTLGLILDSAITEDDQMRIRSVAEGLGSPSYDVKGDGWSAVSLGDGARPVDVEAFYGLPGIERIVEVRAPYRLASRELFDPRPVQLGEGARSRRLGGPGSLIVGVSPVAPDGGKLTPERQVAIAKAAGGTIVFADGLSSDAIDETSDVAIPELTRLREAAHEQGMLLCLDVGDADELQQLKHLADVLQVGPHSMQNFTLLTELGKFDRPVIIRRGLGATIEEFLLAAEYLLAQGNGRVILCESGINARGSTPRPRFEINAIPLLRLHTHLPVIADVSNASDDPGAIPAIARAAVAAGAEGLVVQVGSNGATAPGDGPIDVFTCQSLLRDLSRVAQAVGRKLVEDDRALVDEPNIEVGDEALPPQHTSPNDILKDTSGTLSTVIERATGVVPVLEVVAQRRIGPPYPEWLAWRLRPEGDLLVRWTRYRIGSDIVTRNLAYVDFGRVDPEVLGSLEAEEVNLGELFARSDIDRFGYEFGAAADRSDFESVLQQGHLDAARSRPYVWRRYIAATSGRVGFMVIETLPTVSWRRLLRARNVEEPAKGGRG